MKLQKCIMAKKRPIKHKKNLLTLCKKKGIPDDIQEIKLDSAQNVIDVMLTAGFTQSKGEARRLIAQGAVKFDGEKISDIAYAIDKEGVLQSGKRNYAKIIF